MRTSNPVFNSATFQEPMRYEELGVAPATVAPETKAESETMSVSRTAWKTLYLIGITAVSAAASWTYFVNNPGAILWASLSALALGIVSGIVMLRAAKWAGYIVPLFAVGEGAFVAAISVAVVHYSSLSQRIGGTQAEAFELVGQAAGLTLGIAAAVLLGYATGVLRAGPIFTKVIVALTAGVAIYYVVGFLGNLVLGDVIPRLGWQAGPIGIVFSLFVTVLAALNLVLDYQFVVEGARRKLPRHMEWVAAFGILTTLVWLYIELLRLLAKLRR